MTKLSYVSITKYETMILIYFVSGLHNKWNMLQICIIIQYPHTLNATGKLKNVCVPCRLRTAPLATATFLGQQVL
jgi:hypothetical protein